MSGKIGSNKYENLIKELLTNKNITAVTKELLNLFDSDLLNQQLLIYQKLFMSPYLNVPILIS